MTGAASRRLFRRAEGRGRDDRGRLAPTYGCRGLPADGGWARLFGMGGAWSLDDIAADSAQGLSGAG